MTDAVLVWDTSDQLTSSTGDWNYARSLGAWSEGAVVTGQATNLQPDTVYTWRLCGTSATTNDWSVAYPFATDLTAAQTPAFTSAVVSGLDVELGWQDNAATESGYVLQRAEAPAGPYAVIAAPVTDTTSYTDAGLSMAADERHPRMVHR